MQLGAFRSFSCVSWLIGVVALVGLHDFASFLPLVDSVSVAPPMVLLSGDSGLSWLIGFTCFIFDLTYFSFPVVFVVVSRSCVVSSFSGLSRVSPKIGIKCFSRVLLVAHGRKPLKPYFHGPIRGRISEEDRRNV